MKDIDAAMDVIVCHTHQQVMGEDGTWQSTPAEIEVTDVADNANFVEGTCPQCSSGEAPVPMNTDMEQIWEDSGLAMMQHREYVGRMDDE